MMALIVVLVNLGVDIAVATWIPASVLTDGGMDWSGARCGIPRRSARLLIVTGVSALAIFADSLLRTIPTTRKSSSG